MNPYRNTQEIPDDHPIVAALSSGDEHAVRQHLDGGVSPHAPGLIAGALGSGKVGIVEAFLQHGLDLSLPFNTHGETPIFRAICMRNKSIEILNFLLHRGASVGYDPTGSSTPLYHAAEGWPDAVPILLSAGADVNARTDSGRTPLMAAAFGNQIRSMEFLLCAGARLEDQDKEGTTALIVTARAGKAEAAEWLLDHGANRFAVDKAGKSAADWARRNRQAKVLELLEARMGA